LPILQEHCSGSWARQEREGWRGEGGMRLSASVGMTRIRAANAQPGVHGSKNRGRDKNGGMLHVAVSRSVAVEYSPQAESVCTYVSMHTPAVAQCICFVMPLTTPHPPTHNAPPSDHATHQPTTLLRVRSRSRMVLTPRSVAWTMLFLLLGG
jgi:hypothetical protein